MNNNLRWTSFNEDKAAKELLSKVEAGMIWGFPKREIKYEDNIKAAFVIIDDKIEWAGVHNEDMKAYKWDYNLRTFKVPLEPIEYTTFHRWARGMDF